MNGVHILVGPEDADLRIDRYLALCRPELSRSYLQKLIEKGDITVNGKTVKNSFPVKEGDVIACDIPEKIEPDIEAEDIPLDIVYEDEDLLLVNKPRGMVVHPSAGHFSGTLVNALMSHCQGQLSGINGVLRPGIVHRIDRDTSGLLVVCKSDLAHQRLAAQFQVHSISRLYEALAYGRLGEEEITVNAPIGRDPRDRLKMAINEKNGKPAITHIHLMENYADACFTECRLETGRTHQIRVHMTSLGHPLIGDPVYGPKKPRFAADGQMLHAALLGFEHPVTGKYLEYRVPAPEDFQNMQRKLAQMR
ncbi:MAG: RluA family pseudouridine synthase [Lachnospiraceae bacterium]|nr:RluA family pseudouridine synthase [Lachnospiraceae bacterium]